MFFSALILSLGILNAIIIRELGITCHEMTLLGLEHSSIITTVLAQYIYNYYIRIYIVLACCWICFRPNPGLWAIKHVSWILKEAVSDDGFGVLLFEQRVSQQQCQCAGPRLAHHEDVTGPFAAEFTLPQAPLPIVAMWRKSMTSFWILIYPDLPKSSKTSNSQRDVKKSINETPPGPSPEDVRERSFQ